MLPIGRRSPRLHLHYTCEVAILWLYKNFIKISVFGASCLRNHALLKWAPQAILTLVDGYDFCNQIPTFLIKGKEPMRLQYILWAFRNKRQWVLTRIGWIYLGLQRGSGARDLRFYRQAMALTTWPLPSSTLGFLVAPFATLFADSSTLYASSCTPVAALPDGSKLLAHALSQAMAAAVLHAMLGPPGTVNRADCCFHSNQANVSWGKVNVP